MARDKGTLSNIDNSNPADYPNARIKNNTGGGDGTPVNEFVYGDMHEMLAKLMRLYDIPYNGLPDNETNGYQLVSALEALASKNDYVLNMSSASDILRIPVKLGKLRENESIVLKATINKGVETSIRGTLDNVTKTVTFLGDFKINEYVRLINTPTSVVLVRLIDSFNLQSAVSDLGFLVGASQTEEDAGTISNKATTPLRNKTTFAKRVNGSQSGNYLAKPSSDPSPRNGLMTPAQAEALLNITDPLGQIQITSATNVQVTGSTGGPQQDNFNFNYVDVFPPAGKNMTNLAGFMASIAQIDFAGDVDDNDTFWCKWQEQSTKVRVICGASERRATPKVNWMAIWI